MLEPSASNETLLFWWRKQQKCTLNTTNPNSGHSTKRLYNLRGKKMYLSSTLFHLLNTLENTEAWPSSHMVALGERNSKPTPSASKNMWCETHKRPQAEEDPRYIFISLHITHGGRYRNMYSLPHMWQQNQKLSGERSTEKIPKWKCGRKMQRKLTPRT